MTVLTSLGREVDLTFMADREDLSDYYRKQNGLDPRNRIIKLEKTMAEKLLGDLLRCLVLLPSDPSGSPQSYMEVAYITFRDYLACSLWNADSSFGCLV
jgi:hypothetical protein